MWLKRIWINGKKNAYPTDNTGFGPDISVSVSKWLKPYAYYRDSKCKTIQITGILESQLNADP